MGIIIKTNECISNIKTWFRDNSGGGIGAVIGISGGKDSAIVAALCCKALGSDSVLGVLMPNGVQNDISDSIATCNHLGIKYCEVNIKDSFDNIVSQLDKITCDAKINIVPRLRMATLYAIAQSKNYRVIGTSNLSERYIGYCTKWGDMACDFNPISNFTSDEIIAMGKYLGLPNKILKKPPADGLSGMTDEEKIGFSYDVLNEYIKTGICDDEIIKEKIDKMHADSRHKFQCDSAIEN